jgi:diguanylate cyclase (GGDEF)-like protein
VQQEEAFLCGLLADLGILVLHRVVGADYDALYVQAAGDQDALLDLCRQKFEMDHAQVGAVLAEHWQLPPVLAKPIAQHHCPTETDPALKPLVEAVYVAMIIGDVFASHNPARHILRARNEMAARFKLSTDDIEALLAEIGASTREAAKLFDLNIGQNRSYQEIVDEAQQTIIQLSLQSQQQVQTIKKENETLHVKATTDPLTGLANRARFNDFFDDHFVRAYKMQRPLSVLFLDIDHFKSVNDTHGHQAGDEVLKRVGKLLKLAVRNIDLAARYGGEEFAIVLTETDSNAAAQMADEIRQALEAEQIPFENKVLRITGSIGVAGTDRTRIFSQSAQLTNAADRAVYAAKSAGRNCVRLFRPKVPAASAAAPAAR